MAKKVKVVYEGSPSGSWMVTFSDMNTLLLTFFVLLFSMSTIAPDTFDEAFQSNSGDRLGLISKDQRTYSSRLVFDPMPAIPKKEVSSALNVFRSEQDQFHKKINIPNGVEILFADAPYGVVTIVLADRILFLPGQAELSDENREILLKVREFVVRILSVLPRRVIVEGHTDNTAPVEERFMISSQRAEAVLQFLLEDGTLPPELFSLIGYGSTKPIVPNTSDVNRARNRRVRIVLEPPDNASQNILF